MLLIKRLFFAIFACIGVICFSIPNAFGLAADSCSTGGEYQYCGLWRKCKTCPANCYCPKRANPNTVSCTGWTGLKCEAGVLKSNTNATQDQGSYGVYACPSDFPNAPEGAKSAEECYVQCGTQKLPNKVIHCAPGSALHYRSTSCTSCKGNVTWVGMNNVCPGGNFYPSCGKIQGTQKCDGGKIPNADRSACVSQTVSCPAGQYLPKGKSECIKCASFDNVYCPGITNVSVDNTKDQGLLNCPEHYKSSDNKSCYVASCKAGQYMYHGKQCNDCPSRFPKSEEGTNDESECYTLASDGKTKLYNKLIVVPAGQYLPKESMNPAKCPSGKYCKGSAALGKPEGWGPRFGEYGDIGAYDCDAGQKPNADATACVSTEIKCKSGEYLDGKTCKACASRFPKSESGATAESQCYTLASDGKTKLYNKLIVVPAGQYLPKESMSPAKCPSGKYCKGSAALGKPEGWGPRFGEYGDIGAYNCDAGQKPNAEQTACVKKEEPKKEETKKEEPKQEAPKTATCEPGYYLPSGLSTCETCLDGSACKGGTFTVKSGNQGIVECKVGYEIVSDDKTKCVTTAAKCKKGFYLKANKEKCSVCEGVNKYCPGGDFGLADKDQGIHSCPTGGDVNGDRSGCRIKLSKSSMYYGTGYRSDDIQKQCWPSKNTEEYSTCLFGITD